MSSVNVTDHNPLGNVTAYGGAVVVAALPTMAMLLGSALVMTCHPSSIVQACLQNFSAGIILAVRFERHDGQPRLAG